MSVYHGQADKICPNCNSPFAFSNRHKDQVFCSKKCACEARTKHRVFSCERCGCQFEGKKAGRRFCSRACHNRSIVHPVRESKSYRMMSINGACVRVHRYVMEQHLGRKLRSDEVVHHKDGNKQNNDISNLEIVSPSEHPYKHCSYRNDKEKTCNRCKVVKPLEDFNRSNACKDGRASFCRVCKNESMREFRRLAKQ